MSQSYDRNELRHRDESHSYSRRAVVLSAHQKAGDGAKWKHYKRTFPTSRQDFMTHDHLSQVRQMGNQPSRNVRQLSPVHYTPSNPQIIMTDHSNEQSHRMVKPKQLAGIQTRKDQHANREQMESEFEWIHQHFPVLKLVHTMKHKIGSRILKQELFIGALHVFIRAEMRYRWNYWCWVCDQLQIAEQTRYIACNSIIDTLQTLVNSNVYPKFRIWRHKLETERANEQISTIVKIQTFLRQRKATWEKHRLMLKQQSSAVLLQKILRGYLHRMHYIYMCKIVRQVQRKVRFILAHRECKIYIDHIAMCIFNYVMRVCDAREAERRNLATLRIQGMWRIVISRWNQKILVHVAITIHEIINMVERNLAAERIQLSIRKYLGRLLVKHQYTAAFCIQQNYRNFKIIRHAKRHLKKCIQQRTYAIYVIKRQWKEAKLHRRLKELILPSNIPLHIQARSWTHLERESLITKIYKSATNSIQIYWRKRQELIAYKYLREKACKTICMLLKSICMHRKWHEIVKTVYTIYYTHQRLSVKRIERWRKSILDHRCSIAAALEREKIQNLRKCVLMQMQRRSKANDIQTWYRTMSTQYKHKMARHTIEQWLRPHMRRHQDNIQYLAIEMLRKDKAIRTIQSLCKSYHARKQGKILMAQYKILRIRELRVQQQRETIHQYLTHRKRLQADRMKQTQLHLHKDMK